MKYWTLEDIPWSMFERDAVETSLLCVVKAAALVERNSADYAAYLCNVFPDDPALHDAFREWALEEIQHGDALGAWATRVDPTFDFQASFQRFVNGYHINVDADRSVRGTRSGELIARCVVETGTSSFYTALRDATREPVLAWICNRIAGDEFRHYKLFFVQLERYLQIESLSVPRRAWVALGRYREMDDDELAYAYHTANTPAEPYNRRRSSADYSARAFRHYRFHHIQRAVGMVLKASGLEPQGPLGRIGSYLAWHHLRRHVRQAEAA